MVSTLPSIGIDITDIERFRGLSPVKDKELLGKIFTSGELKYCFSKENPAPHLAVRFAAKEAVVKALSALEIPPTKLSNIEIVQGQSGVPKITLHVPKLKHGAIQLSLSHNQSMAVAVALIGLPN